MTARLERMNSRLGYPLAVWLPVGCPLAVWLSVGRLGYPVELTARLAADSRADGGSQPSWDQMILPDAETRTNQGWS